MSEIDSPATSARPAARVGAGRRPAAALCFRRRRSTRMSVEAMTPAQERFYLASQWRMMWWRLRRHRVAVVSGALLLVMYAIDPVLRVPRALRRSTPRNTDFIYAPPQRVHIFDDGRLVAPFVYGYDYQLDMTNLRRVYTPNPEKREPSASSASGDRYLLLGLRRRAIFTSSARPRAGSCSCSAPTGSAAICCRASSTGRASR